MANLNWRFFVTTLALAALPCILTSNADAASSAPAGQAIINLSPSGADDTVILQGALDSAECHMPKRCTIRLAPGGYTIGLLYTKGFHGKLEGAGQGKTVLSALPGLDTTNADLFLPPGKENHLPHLIVFDDGDFEIRDLTIQAIEPNPTLGWGIPAFGFSADYLISLLNITGVATESVVERVAVKGVPKPGSIPSNGYNVLNGTFHQTMPIFGVDLIPRLGGRHVVSGCDFDTVSQGSSLFGLENGAITFGGSPGKGNRYRNVYAAFDLADSFAASVTVSYNKISSGCGGLTLYQSGLWSPAALTPAGYDISNNQFHLQLGSPVPAGCGVGISLNGGRAVGPATKLVSNVVVGSGAAAVQVNGDVSDIILSDNHIQGFHPEIAHIWLGAQTFDIRVTGVTPSMVILDEGTANLILK